MSVGGRPGGGVAAARECEQQWTKPVTHYPIGLLIGFIMLPSCYLPAFTKDAYPSSPGSIKPHSSIIPYPSRKQSMQDYGSVFFSLPLYTGIANVLIHPLLPLEGGCSEAWWVNTWSGETRQTETKSSNKTKEKNWNCSFKVLAKNLIKSEFKEGKSVISQCEQQAQPGAAHLPYKKCTMLLPCKLNLAFSLTYICIFYSKEGTFHSVCPCFITFTINMLLAD